MLPSGQITAAITLDVVAEMVIAIPLLEDLYYADLTVDGVPLPAHLARLTADIDPEPDRFEIPTERHQIVYAHAAADRMPSDDVLQRVIYRADLPARNGTPNSAISHPAELNRRPTTAGALGPYVSVIVGMQDYVENAALLTAVQVVTAGARLRQLRQQAYDGVEALRSSSSSATEGSMHERRLALEAISDRLRSLELDLSYSVEAVADLGMLVPALRVESYHQALIDSMSLTSRASTTGRMLERLANAITFVTTTAGTIGLLFAFLGVNAREVDPARSMFHRHYLPIYLTIAALVLVGVIVFSSTAWLQTRQSRTGPPTPR